jgi:hypothetical protein
MKLTEQLETGNVQVLPVHDNVVETGNMGCCVCVVVLWHPYQGSFQQVQGYHGWGGIERVNWNSLRQNVVDANTTQFYIFVGNDEKSDHARKVINTAVKTEIHQHFPLALKRIFYQLCEASVTRTVGEEPTVRRGGW